MNACWLCSLFVIIISISMANSKFDLDSPVRLARCRASCVHQINVSPVSDVSCQRSIECSQCWNSCQVLQTLADSRLFCSQQECGAGCLEACRFQSISPSHVAPVPVEEVLFWSDSRVSWPPVVQDLGVVVYVVMADGTQLCQTLDSSVTIPPNVDPTTLRVLVVDWRGLVKLLSPGAESPIAQVIEVLRSLGLEKKMGLPIRSHLEREDISTTVISKPQVTVDKQWRINAESLHHQPSLVLAQISWRPHNHQLVMNNQLIETYLVTWTVDGGAVRGNLLTNTSTVTLSLWPDTVYRIQVALFSLESPGIQSEPLILDTHQVQTKSASTLSSQKNTSRLSGTPTHEHIDGDLQTDSHTQIRQGERARELTAVGGREAVAGVSAAVIVFLGVVLAATWRWRHRLNLPHSKLLDEETEAPNLYRVFPPVMRLIGETDRSSDMFSSTDNLLQDN